MLDKKTAAANNKAKAKGKTKGKAIEEPGKLLLDLLSITITIIKIEVYVVRKGVWVNECYGISLEQRNFLIIFPSLYIVMSTEEWNKVQ